MIETNQKNDPVNHPNHYLKAAITLEPIELTARMDACLGQAVNYVLRAPHKGNFREDIEKAIFYLHKSVRVNSFQNEPPLAIALGKCFAHFTHDWLAVRFLRTLFPEHCINMTEEQVLDARLLLQKELMEMDAREKAYGQEPPAMGACEANCEG